jgi:preprotein translocase subunit Sec63
LEQQKVNQYYRSPAFLLKIIFLVVFSIAAYVCLQQVALEPAGLKGFDPYELLEV